MPGKITMNLANPNVQIRYQMAAAAAKPAVVAAPRFSALNAPMINRVHKAKAGCSACGKKVA